VAGLLGLAALNAFAADVQDPVLNLLLKKGVVSEEEARNAQIEADSIRTNGVMPSSESKWKISKAIKDVELYGDVRLRYEERQVNDPDEGKIRLQRLRYALRLGLRGDLFDDFYYGLRLETAVNPRSPWVTFGTSASGTPYQGPFGKSTAGITLGQAYLGWREGSWLDITAGKMPNPLYTTPMLWDTDLNPEGVAERFKYTVGQADFFATFGQFIYQDTNPTETSPGYFGIGSFYPSPNGSTSDLTFMLAWQAGVNFRFTTNISFKVAPAFYTYTGHGVDTTQSASLTEPGFGGIFVGQGATNGAAGIPAAGFSGFPGGFYNGFAANQTGINNLMVLDVPWQFDFKVGWLRSRVFGDFAQNLDGRARARAAYNEANSPLLQQQVGGVRTIPSPQVNDDKAYQIGLALGNGDLGLVYGTASRRHTWEARAYWQHIEQYALDPNLLDSDFFEGRGNLEGIYSALAYSFTDNFIGTVRFGYASRINDKLGTGGSNQDIPQMNPINRYHILQVDLTMRF
jgi:Putative porin